MPSRWPWIKRARFLRPPLLCLILAGWLLGPCLSAPAHAQAATAPGDDQLQVAIEALQRLKGMDLEANPALKAAVLKVLQRTAGTPHFIELVRDFRLNGQGPALLEYASAHPDEAAGAEAIRLVLADEGIDLIARSLDKPNATPLVRALSHVPDKALRPVLQSIASDRNRDVAMRKEAVHALSQTEEGAQFLVTGADGNLRDLREAIAADLRNARWPAIRAKAAALQPASEHPDSGPAPPPVTELVRLNGVASRGAEVLRRETVGCIKCHQVNGEGADFGPNLSEIGTKLAKEAIYEAILDPSAGISFGFEAWQLELRDGEEAYGLLASETADEVAIKAQSGVVSRFRKSEIVQREKQKTSIMPSGLAQTMSQQDLVDLVEYLSSLRKRP